MNLFSLDYNRCPPCRQPPFVAVGANFGGNVTNNPQICLTLLASPILTKTCSLTQKENNSGIENTNILTPRWSSSKRCLTQPLALCWSLSLSLFWPKGYHILHSLPEALSQQDALCLEAISRTEHRWVINQSTCCSKCIRGSYSLEPTSELCPVSDPDLMIQKWYSLVSLVLLTACSVLCQPGPNTSA